MSEAKHTPGPWKVCKNGSGDLCIGTSEDEPWYIAEMCLGAQGDDVPVDPAEANARLIAAAPDMLNALRAFDRAYECEDSAEYTGLINEANNLMVAAIAKATGAA